MAPSAARFAEAMGGLGIGDDSRVVLYSAGSIMWATRVWWMLRAFGFDRAAVLDGGWEKWQAEGRPVSSTPGRYPPARFTARLKPGQFVDSDYVLSRLGDADTVAVNALAPEFHLGEGPEPLRTAGADSGERQRACGDAARSVERGLRAVGRSAKQLHEEAGITPDRHVVAYCGGGISATVGLFLLHQLGYTDLTLYDGSMGEWAYDPDLPIETGPQTGETR